VVPERLHPQTKKVIFAMRTLFRIFVFAAGLVLVTSSAIAQQRVHALSGTVTAIHPKLHMIEVATDDGSSGQFEFLKSGTSIEFDKSVSADATAPDKFETTQAHVIVYFVGQGDVRSVVAVHPLGDGQLKTIKGTVVKFNRHDHLLIVKNDAGSEQTFTLDAKTIADTETGVTPGFKADFDRGRMVRVTALESNGTTTALLVAHVLW
jgi:hypothetical protein